MRRVIHIVASLAAIWAAPAAAWHADQPAGLCRITHSEPTAEVELTFDLSTLVYAITVTTPEAWPDDPMFAMRFDGPYPNYITTGRHELSNAGRSLTVSDQGFGNVLDGLEYNIRAIAMSGNTALILPLDGPAPAAPAVAAFRSCTSAPSA